MLDHDAGVTMPRIDEVKMKPSRPRWKNLARSLTIAAAFPLCANAAQQSCDAALSAAIPPRAADASSGSAFARQLQGMDDESREAAILREFSAGNMPRFLRRLSPVSLDSQRGTGASGVTICVMPDYLAIGSDDDYFLAPMRLQTALAIATRFGFTLPTRHMVDAVYTQSPVHLQPQPLPAGDAMRSTAYYWRHNNMVREQRATYEAPLGTLTSGDKKDLVLTGRLWTMQDRVAIYGWHKTDGKPIQPLSTVHGWRYADYSHGVRLVANMAYVDGTAHALSSLLDDTRYARLFSDEGPIPRIGELIGVLDRLTPGAPRGSVLR